MGRIQEHLVGKAVGQRHGCGVVGLFPGLAQADFQQAQGRMLQAFRLGTDGAGLADGLPQLADEVLQPLPFPVARDAGNQQLVEEHPVDDVQGDGLERCGPCHVVGAVRQWLFAAVTASVIIFAALITTVATSRTLISFDSMVRSSWVARLG